MRLEIPRMLLLLAATSIGATALAEPEVRARHKDWTIVCDTPQGSETERCSMVQALNHRESNRQVLRIEVGYLGQSPQPVAIVTVPLGIALPPGLTMRIDDGEAQKYQFGQCIPAGCIVGVQLSEQQIAVLKAGTQAHLTFHDSRQRPITLPVSLQGFTAAFADLNR